MLAKPGVRTMASPISIAGNARGRHSDQSADVRNPATPSFRSRRQRAARPSPRRRNRAAARCSSAVRHGRGSSGRQRQGRDDRACGAAAERRNAWRGATPAANRPANDVIGPGCQPADLDYIAPGDRGGMAEWLKALAWKACIRETVSWVRIPLPPPAACQSSTLLGGRSLRRSAPWPLCGEAIGEPENGSGPRRETAAMPSPCGDRRLIAQTAH